MSIINRHESSNIFESCAPVLKIVFNKVFLHKNKQGIKCKRSELVK
jgi:hypothetical protein